MILTLMRHEWRRAFRTKRVWIVLAFCLFSALLDPVSTKFLPKIIEAVGKVEVMGLPDQSAADALKAYASDSSRLAMLAFALSFMGMATDEFRRDSGSGVCLYSRCEVVKSGLVQADRGLWRRVGVISHRLLRCDARLIAAVWFRAGRCCYQVDTSHRTVLAHGSCVAYWRRGSLALRTCRSRDSLRLTLLSEYLRVVRGSGSLVPYCSRNFGGATGRR